MIVLLIVAWAGYLAIAYVVKSVFVSVSVPDHFRSSVMQLNCETIQQDLLLDEDASRMRVPLGHYHGIDRWFSPDVVNGCTTDRCHTIMPHNKKVAVRAFNNFHTSFLACQMCHEYESSSNYFVAWTCVDSGNSLDAPAILRLKLFLETESTKIDTDSKNVHLMVVELLSEALSVSGNDPILEHLLIEISTSEPASPAWKNALQQLTKEIPLHARGEYGAKMAISKNGKNDKSYKKKNQKLKELAKKYHLLEGEVEKEQIYDEIHSELVNSPQDCLSCHTRQKAMFDFEELGYSPKHAEILRELSIAGKIQDVQEGRQFYIKTHKGVGP